MSRTIKTDNTRTVTEHRPKSRRVTAREAREIERILAATLAFDVPANTNAWLELA